MAMSITALETFRGVVDSRWRDVVTTAQDICRATGLKRIAQIGSGHFRGNLAEQVVGFAVPQHQNFLPIIVSNLAVWQLIILRIAAGHGRFVSQRPQSLRNMAHFRQKN